MKMKKILTALLISLPLLVNAASITVPASTMTNMTFIVNFPTHPTLSQCNTFYLDVTGNVNYGGARWSAYGALNCKNNSGYVVTGSAFVGTNNHIYLNEIFSMNRVFCDLTVGTCTLVDEAAGNKIYYGTIK